MYHRLWNRVLDAEFPNLDSLAYRQNVQERTRTTLNFYSGAARLELTEKVRRTAGLVMVKRSGSDALTIQHQDFALLRPVKVETLGQRDGDDPRNDGFKVEATSGSYQKHHTLKPEILKIWPKHIALR